MEDYVRKCDSCQRRKEDRVFVAPVGEVEVYAAPFLVKSVEITEPYLITRRKVKYVV